MCVVWLGCLKVNLDVFWGWLVRSVVWLVVDRFVSRFVCLIVGSFALLVSLGACLLLVMCVCVVCSCGKLVVVIVALLFWLFG